MTFSLSSLITLFGLILDIIGAWYISRGLVKKTREDIKKETGFCFGPNDNYIISGLSQKAECKVGFIFLLFGFMLQGVGNLLPSFSFNSCTPIFYRNIILVGLFFIILCFIISNKIIKKIIKNYILIHVSQVIKEHIKASNDSPMHIGDIKRYLDYLNINFDEEIKLEEAWQKLKEGII